MPPLTSLRGRRAVCDRRGSTRGLNRFKMCPRRAARGRGLGAPIPAAAPSPRRARRQDCGKSSRRVSLSHLHALAVPVPPGPGEPGLALPPLTGALRDPDPREPLPRRAPGSPRPARDHRVPIPVSQQREPSSEGRRVLPKAAPQRGVVPRPQFDRRQVRSELF